MPWSCLPFYTEVTYSAISWTASKSANKCYWCYANCKCLHSSRPPTSKHDQWMKHTAPWKKNSLDVSASISRNGTKISDSARSDKEQCRIIPWTSFSQFVTWIFNQKTRHEWCTILEEIVTGLVCNANYRLIWTSQKKTDQPNDPKHREDKAEKKFSRILSNNCLPKFSWVSNMVDMWHYSCSLQSERCWKDGIGSTYTICTN
jgi:hypothetical protein